MNPSPPSATEDLWFEDFVPGAVYEFGAIRVAEAEILDFARRFDPQPMHLDPEAAARGHFGGLIASGWHTAGLMMRLFVDHFLPHSASVGSPGIDEYRFSNEVVRILRDRGAQVILGNHEEGFLGPHGARARQAEWIDRTLLDWLAERPHRVELAIGGKTLL